MRAIVTGGAGFIGSHLIEALIERGDAVVCVERAGASRRWIERLPVAVLECGLGDAEPLRRAFDGADVVFHLAGLVRARTPRDFYTVNARGTEQVMRAAAAHNGRAPRVILASSLAAVGPCLNGEPLSPESAPGPLSHYGQSKLCAEMVAHAYGDRVPATVLRFPSVYGPRERGIFTFLRLVQRGVALTIGGWDRELSMIYVKDLIEPLIAAATSDTAVGKTYCLGHPDPVTWRGFAQTAGAVLGRAPLLISLPRPAAALIALLTELAANARGRVALIDREKVREMAQPRWVCDPSRAVVDLGFRPAFPLVRGIRATVDWCREVGWL